MVSTAAGTLMCLATPGSAASEDPRPGSEEAGVCGPGGSRPGLSFPQAGRSPPPGHVWMGWVISLGMDSSGS